MTGKQKISDLLFPLYFHALRITWNSFTTQFLFSQIYISRFFLSFSARKCKRLVPPSLWILHGWHYHPQRIFFLHTSARHNTQKNKLATKSCSTKVWGLSTRIFASRKDASGLLTKVPKKIRKKKRQNSFPDRDWENLSSARKSHPEFFAVLLSLGSLQKFFFLSFIHNEY